MAQKAVLVSSCLVCWMCLTQWLYNIRSRIYANSYLGIRTFVMCHQCKQKRGRQLLPFTRKMILLKSDGRFFKLLRAMRGLRFFAVVADKRSVLEYVRRRNEDGSGYRYHPNDLYDSLVRRLLNEKLHKKRHIQDIFLQAGQIRSHPCIA